MASSREENFETQGNENSGDNDVQTQGQPLSDYLMQLEDYNATIPDAVTAYFLRTSGFEASDPRLLRLISLAAQKCISDIANDALQHCKTRANNSFSSSKSSKNAKDRRYALTLEDLIPALAEYGITVKKPQYFV